MVRSYDPDRAVPREYLEMMMKLAIRAPSAGHTQGWKFLILDDITSCGRFWDVTAVGAPDTWRARMQQAPALVLCFSDRQAYLDRYAEPDKAGSGPADGSEWAIPYWHVDTGMAAMILLLAAHDVGLGACFFGVPADRWPDLGAAFDVPAGLAPVGVVSLGYPAPDLRSPSLRRGRKPFDEVVAYGSFGAPSDD